MSATANRRRSVFSGWQRQYAQSLVGKSAQALPFPLSGVALPPVAPCLHAQQSSLVELIVENKPGANEGRAMATGKGPLKQKGKSGDQREDRPHCDPDGASLDYQNAIYTPTANATSVYLAFSAGRRLAHHQLKRAGGFGAAGSRPATPFRSPPRRVRLRGGRAELHSVTGIPARERNNAEFVGSPIEDKSVVCRLTS